MENIKFIIYNGKKYWISGTKKYFYYTPYNNGIKQKRIALHRKIWEDKSGLIIPEGYEIHHIDGNTLNNEFSNLECISRTDHRAYHSNKKWKDNYQLQKLNLDKAREKALIWHRSEKGKKWHSDHGKETWVKRQKKDCTCKHCGKNYQAFRKGFCSNQCLQRFYYATGKYHENRTCIVCNNTFRVRKSEKTKTCSQDCAMLFRSRNKNKIYHSYPHF